MTWHIVNGTWEECPAEQLAAKLAAAEAERDRLRHDVEAWKKVADVNIEAKRATEAVVVDRNKYIANLTDKFHRTVERQEALLARRPHIFEAIDGRWALVWRTPTSELHNEKQCAERGGACLK